MEQIRHLSAFVRTNLSAPGLPLRLLIIAALAGLSGALFYCRIPAGIGALPLWLFTGLLYAVFIGVSTTFIFAFLPKLGLFAELAAISRLGLAAVSAGKPVVAVALISSPELNATLVVGIAILLSRICRALSAGLGGKDSLFLAILGHLAGLRMRRRAAQTVGAV